MKQTILCVQHLRLENNLLTFQLGALVIPQGESEVRCRNKHLLIVVLNDKHTLYTLLP